jgi:hypothetical protein
MQKAAGPRFSEEANMARRSGAGRNKLVSAVMVLLVVGLTGLAQVPPAAQKTTAPPVTEQDRPQVVPITTVDGAELEGSYFRGTSGRDTPCVLMVHRLGSDRARDANWLGLALALKRAGFAVLTFDLRGHGKSKSVRPEFWTVAANRELIRGGRATRKPTTISHEDFQARYIPMLVNDILAARRFLEDKNDAGELNTNSIFVLGAQEGASLGLLFAAAEFQRVYRVGFVPLQSDGTAHIAGEDIAGVVCLSLTTRTSQGTSFNADNWVRSHPQIREKVSMCFVYGEDDKAAKMDADSVLRTLRNDNREKSKLDTTIALKGTKLAGASLLSQPVLNVQSSVVNYLLATMKARKAIPWSRVDTQVNRLALVNLRPFGYQLP